MSESSPPAARDVPAKPTLFCPECGHRSRIDGDWNLSESARTTQYRCPDCAFVVTTRKSLAPDDSELRSPELWRTTLQTWEEGVRTWQKFWKRALPLY